VTTPCVHRRKDSMPFNVEPPLCQQRFTRIVFKQITKEMFHNVKHTSVLLKKTPKVDTQENTKGRLDAKKQETMTSNVLSFFYLIFSCFIRTLEALSIKPAFVSYCYLILTNSLNVYPLVFIPICYPRSLSPL
jgi:hypothetical protein